MINQKRFFILHVYFILTSFFYLFFIEKLGSQLSKKKFFTQLKKYVNVNFMKLKVTAMFD